MRWRMSDPATAVTDYILGIEAAAFAVLLFAATRGQYAVIVWASAFVVMSLAALAGGIFHHGRERFAARSARFLWKLTSGGLFACILLFVAGGLFAGIHPPLRTYLLVVLAAVAALVLFRGERPQPVPPRRRVAPVILAVLLPVLGGFWLRQWVHGGPAVGTWILAGAFFCCAGTLVQQAAPKIHPRFNHNDVCHVLFMIGIWFLYRGGLLLNDKL